MYRVRLLLLLLSLSAITTTLADIESVRTQASIHAEIDRTVWRPFKEAFETLNGQALNQVYGSEVLRVTPAGIDTRNRFKLSNFRGRFLGQDPFLGDPLTARKRALRTRKVLPKIRQIPTILPPRKRRPKCAKKAASRNEPSLYDQERTRASKLENRSSKKLPD